LESAVLGIKHRSIHFQVRIIMRIADVDFVMVPEWLADTTRSKSEQVRAHDDDHWICRWQRNFATAAWLDGSHKAPADALVAQTAERGRPVLIVTHGHGVDVLLAAREALATHSIAGALMVAPKVKATSLPQLEKPAALSFPSLVVASDDHPEFTSDEARRLADHLGSHFVSAGPAGRIDSGSGQGPWPEGLMRLGWFLKQLRMH